MLGIQECVEAAELQFSVEGNRVFVAIRVSVGDEEIVAEKDALDPSLEEVLHALSKHYTVEPGPAYSHRREMPSQAVCLNGVRGNVPCALSGCSATLPEVRVQRAGSIPILSFTADEILWV